MKRIYILGLVVISTLFISGCVTANGNQASPKVQEQINKYNLEVVDFEYTKNAIGKGTKKSAKAILVDARPNLKYKKSTIPSSINIPDTKYDEFVSALKETIKSKEIIVYCGGWKCGKSPKVASLLKRDGFTNVKLYQAGEPEWIKKTYKEVDLIVVKAAQAKNSAILIDARPYKMFLKETIPSSISIPDTQIKTLVGRFPTNKLEKIIVYCGGYKCVKSHNVANELISLGYKNVSVFAGGLPIWKKANLSTTAQSKNVLNTQTSKKKSISTLGVKLGSDEGTVDGEWFKKLIVSNKIPTNLQIIDVTSKEEFKDGHLKGAINIDAEKVDAKVLFSKLPKNKAIVFNCTAGGRSLEAWMNLKDAGFDVSEIFYFDANIDCINNKCKIEVNEPLD